MKRWPLILAGIAAGGVAFAQPGWDWEPDPNDRGGVPMWEVDPAHPEDVFTFARVKYSSYGRRGRRGWGRGWSTDYPASDYNLSYRLQQLTSLKVNPHPKVLELTDPAIFDHPFLYMIEPGALAFSDEEAAALRRHLYAGGFLMIDDFWGESEWSNFHDEMKRVFPERAPVELELDHPIFGAVFPLKAKPQVPSIHAWQGARVTYERYDAREPHYWAWYDDAGRMVAIACHNTDLGDGWEREGEDPEYFRLFAEPQSYPMGINIIFYAMTH